MKVRQDNPSVIPILIAGIFLLAALFSVPYMIHFYGQKAPPSVATASAAQVPRPGPPLYIAQSTAYKDPVSSSTIIVGDIQNVSPFPVTSVNVKATIFDSGNPGAGIPPRAVYNASSQAYLDSLRTGEHSAFKIAVPAFEMATGAKHYTLATSSFIAIQAKLPYLNLILGQPYIDRAGQYHIVGEIINEAPLVSTPLVPELPIPKVSTNFYDATGKMLDAGFAYTQPTSPGEVATFDIKPVLPNIAQNAKFALTNVQSDSPGGGYSSMNYDASGNEQQQIQSGCSPPVATNAMVCFGSGSGSGTDCLSQKDQYDCWYELGFRDGWEKSHPS